jgi:hypothetical protein
VSDQYSDIIKIVAGIPTIKSTDRFKDMIYFI